jgi:hypothetical protein
MKAKYLIYFCNDFDSVYDSQVIDLLKSINKKKIFKKVYLFQGIRNELQIHEFAKKILPEDIDLIFYRSYPNYPIFNFLLRKKILTALKKSLINLEESILHTRGELLAWHLMKIVDKKYHINILPDIRGTIVEEIREFRNLNYLLKYLKIWNYKKALNAIIELNKISVVSPKLKEYLVNYYNKNSKNISITQCLAALNFKYDVKQRIKVRKELNVKETDNLIIFSSGSIALWENNHILKYLADKEIKILNLSKNAIVHKNIINKFVEYSKVSSYLNAADIAIIWREKSIVNQVAFPVKFSEYICCGLPVIANDSVDIITNYVTSSSFGLLINNINEIDTAKINKLISLNRQEISAQGIKWLGVETISEKYMSIYSSIYN